MDRSTPEGEAEFRKQQKHGEVQQLLAAMPSTVEAFVASSNWTKNKSDNFVFRAPACPSATIFIKEQGINWCLPGGKPSWGPGGFSSVDEAKRDLWTFAKGFEEDGGTDDEG